MGVQAQVFDTLATARAAFALGPVKFRCNVCGRTHWSDSPAAVLCGQRLSNEMVNGVGIGCVTGTVRTWERVLSVRKRFHFWLGIVGSSDPGSVVPPWFCDDVRLWKRFVSVLDRLIRASSLQWRWPPLGELYALAVSRAIVLEDCASWTERARAEIEKRVQAYDAAHADECRCLEELAERLCVPRSFPPVHCVTRQRGEEGRPIVAVCFDRGAGKLEKRRAWDLFWPQMFSADLILPGWDPKRWRVADWHLTAFGTDPGRAIIVACVVVRGLKSRKTERWTVFPVLEWAVGVETPRFVGVVPARWAYAVEDALSWLIRAEDPQSAGRMCGGSSGEVEDHGSVSGDVW